jgi:uncharacterized protein YgbK (DUF1537 family)
VPFHTWTQIEAAIKKGGLTKIQIGELWDSLFLGEKEVQELLAWVKENAEHPFVYIMFALGSSQARIIGPHPFNCQMATFNTAAKLTQIR